MNEVVVEGTKRGEIRGLVPAAAADRAHVVDVDEAVRAAAFSRLTDVRAPASVAGMDRVLFRSGQGFLRIFRFIPVQTGFR